MNLSAKAVKRSLTLKGHATSVTLEPAFWQELENISKRKSLSIPTLIAEIDTARGDNTLSSAIRVYVLNHLRD